MVGREASVHIIVRACVGVDVDDVEGAVLAQVDNEPCRTPSAPEALTLVGDKAYERGSSAIAEAESSASGGSGRVWVGGGQAKARSSALKASAEVHGGTRGCGVFLERVDVGRSCNDLFEAQGKGSDVE